MGYKNELDTHVCPTCGSDGVPVDRKYCGLKSCSNIRKLDYISRYRFQNEDLSQEWFRSGAHRKRMMSIMGKNSNAKKRTCRNCPTEMPLFSSKKYCSDCLADLNRLRNRQYYAKNSEKEATRKALWYAKNKEKINERKAERAKKQ